MFKFRLQKILDLRERLEDLKKNEYGIAKKKLNDAIRKRDMMVAKKESLIEEMKTLDGTVALLKKRNEYTKYIDYLKEVIEKMNQNITILTLEAEEKRKELEEAVKDRKILDKFKDKEKEKWRREEIRLENAITNEIVSYKYTVKEEE